MSKILKIVTIGGGSGQFILLSALKNIENINISAIVSMSDSGGSSGLLRDKLGVLPPGDILKCLVALSTYGNARDILQKRFTVSGLKGHNAGNMLLTQLATFSNSFPVAVKALGEILNVKGQVLPVTTDRSTLTAELSDGNLIYGEATIDVPRGPERGVIKKVFLVPHHSDKISVYPPVLKAIKAADYIIIGPGDLFTSILPNLLVDKVSQSIKNSSAQLLYILNLMTKYGETNGYTAMDFVNYLEEKLSRQLDIIVANDAQPSTASLRRYQKQKADWIKAPDNPERNIIKADLLEEKKVVRHDPEKLKKVLEEIFFK